MNKKSRKLTEPSLTHKEGIDHALYGAYDQAEQQMRVANEIVYASPDSDLSVAEHLVEEVAHLCIEMRLYDQADEVVLQPEQQRRCPRRRLQMKRISFSLPILAFRQS